MQFELALRNAKPELGRARASSLRALHGRLLELDWNFDDASAKDSVHSIHPYPAKFIPEIPRQLIRELRPAEDSLILDPFCGSGTTLVEAQHAGSPAVGVDLNPIACLLSRVKTAGLPDGLLGVAEKYVVRARKLAVSPPEIPNLDHWFKKDVQGPIAALATVIARVKSPALKDALRLALSSIVVRVSNQDSDTRYAAVEKKIRPEDVFTFFLASAKRIEKACAPVPGERLPPVRVLHRDILETSPPDVGARVGLVITSPPYPNAYEYWLYHKYRMYWLGFDPLEVKRREIGARAHFFKKHHHTADDFVRQMETTMGLLQRVTLPGAFVCFVVGRSRIHGRDVDNAAIIEAAGKSAGIDPFVTLTRRIASSRKSFNLSHARIQEERIVILRKA